jgi:hypothetical protein
VLRSALILWLAGCAGVDGRPLPVAFTGDASRPGASRGAILVDDGVAEHLVAVGAVVGAADLPEGLRWTDDGEGLSTTARLPTAPFDADAIAVSTALDHATLLAAHAAVMAEDRAYARWLVETDLPARPDAAPELRYAVPAGSGRARVGWRLGRGDLGTEVIVESPPGVEVGRGTGDELVVPVDGPVAVRQVGGPPSDRYGATGSDWLVVDGFDPVIGGSWEAPTHALGARVAATLPAATAHHAALTAGLVDLADYARVLWMLGDESTLDHTFDAAERAAVQAFLADDEVLWRYGDGTAAAVRSTEGVVVIGFALDTLGDADLAAALTALDGLTRRASSRASAGSTRTSAPR